MWLFYRVVFKFKFWREIGASHCRKTKQPNYNRQTLERFDNLTAMKFFVDKNMSGENAGTMKPWLSWSDFRRTRRHFVMLSAQFVISGKNKEGGASYVCAWNSKCFLGSSSQTFGEKIRVFLHQNECCWVASISGMWSFVLGTNLLCYICFLEVLPRLLLAKKIEIKTFRSLSKKLKIMNLNIFLTP